MRQIRILAVGVLVGVSSIGFSQKAVFNLPDVFTGKLTPATLSQLQWIPQTHDYVFVKDNNLMKATAPLNETAVFVPLTDINNALEMEGEKAVKSFPSIAHLDDYGFYFRSAGKLMRYGVVEKKVVIIPIAEDADNIQIDYNNEKMAYTFENDLYVSNFYLVEGSIAQKLAEHSGFFHHDTTHRRINTEQPKEVKFGHVVHRNEFGIDAGSFWSPEGRYLAFYRMDESMVADYPIVNTTSRIAELKNEKYPMAGMKSHEVTLGVYDAATDETIYLKTGEPAEQYLTSVTWSPDEKYIFVGVLNREQNHLKLNQYDAKTGEFVKTLFEEKNERYVEPSDPLYFLPNDPTKFLYVSQKSGWKHLYLYDINGKELKAVTQGNWVVKSFEGFDNKGENIFIYSNKDELTGNRMYIVNLKSGKMAAVCSEEGMHAVQASYDGKYFLDRYSNLKLPAAVSLKDAKGTEISVLLKDTTALSEYNLPETTIGTLKNGNGDDLYYRLIQPIDFDPNKQYPVFLYVYGGPHSQLVTNGWLSGGHFLHYMAQKGYVVFTLDNRGTANRGFEFESTIHRRLGTVEVEDQMVGVNYLKSLPYVDTNRFSVDGWSYGGFMTITLKLQYPEVFKVATAGGPVIDWKYYEVMYGERYMDTPEENPDGYKQSSLLNQVENLDGRLLIIHGAIDPTVVWQNSLQFLTEAVKAGKQVDYFVYPTHEHNVRGIERVHLWEKIEDYHRTYNK
ncbi:MAG: S9 family peptidase [Lentimicrobiaceae bacterium]|nr:S9 family peptidase [Lentimicrobiaceae bacterium]